MSDGARARAEALAALQRSLGPRGEPALQVLASEGLTFDALEASARFRNGRFEGGRMMIEQARPALVEPLFAALGMPIEPAQRLLRVAADAPVIAGWDRGRERPVAKLYLNLSDASRMVRQRIAHALGLRGAPHVLGINVGRIGGDQVRVERKAYFQLPALPEDAPAVLHRLAAGQPLAGVVQSADVGEDGGISGRAVFLAPTDADHGRALLHALPGWDEAAFSAAIPFPWEQVRSVGFAQDGASWVAYVKPLGQGRPLWSLDPVVCVRTPGGELGIFVAPRSGREQAYCVAGEHALSYRVRAGEPRQDEVATVMAWAAARVAQGAAEWTWPQPPEGFDVVAH